MKVKQHGKADVLYMERSCGKYCVQSETKTAGVSVYCCETDGCNTATVTEASGAGLILWTICVAFYSCYNNS